MTASNKKAAGAEKALGNRIRRCRYALGITKAQLASIAKLPRAPISRHEKGQTSDMSLGIFTKLARALGVSADYLAGRSEAAAYFRNPRLQRLMKNLETLESADLECLHELYLILLEKRR